MKKLLVLFVALAVASTAFAADFSFSWDTDWGWASDFDEVYNSTFSELELALEADIDEYNKFFMEVEPKSATFTDQFVVDEDDNDLVTDGVDTFDSTDTDLNNVIGMNSFKITTDMGAYLGLSGVAVSWVNGYTDPGDEEYADVLRVGLQNAGINAVDLTKDWTTDVNLDFGAFWASAAANWNLGAADAAAGTEYQFLVGTVDAVAGLSLEAGVKMFDDGTDSGNVFQVDGAYVFPVDDAMSLTAAGSFANASEGFAWTLKDSAGTELATGSLDQKFGAGLGVDYAVDDMTALNASVEFSGDDDESFREMAGGVGLAYGDMGADVDFAYAMKESWYLNADEDDVADGELLGVDISGYVKIGMVQFRVGYAVTDYGWANNNRAAVPTEGGAYMRVTADF
ncbi:hypothetical protein [Marispirochaeta aestuarii]|uniref:hypothetical protein n=1 Tax=Marispirochaeta aestuarii TaxID=1963862 RepID=UPI0029C60E77|nr:hypothetical protein [Marispirochaeta aestuarii]